MSQNKQGLFQNERVFVFGGPYKNYEQIFKNIDDILWKESGCSNELDYVEQTSEEIYTKQLANCDELKQAFLAKAFNGKL